MRDLGHPACESIALESIVCHKAKAAAQGLPLFVNLEARRSREAGSGSKLDGLDVLGLEALGSTHDVELHALTFLQAAEAVRANRGKVNENIFVVALASNEAETLCVVKPLDCALFHGDVFLKYLKFADIGARQNAGFRTVQNKPTQ
jgi:hypothetical protein